MCEDRQRELVAELALARMEIERLNKLLSAIFKIALDA